MITTARGPLGNNDSISILPQQAFAKSQQIAFELETGNYKLIVEQILIDVEGKSAETIRAFLAENTAFVFTNEGSSPIKIVGQKGYASNQIFKTKTIHFESLGIGGLEEQFKVIFRRAFASRVFPPSIIQRLGIKHVKGILLFGKWLRGYRNERPSLF